MSKRLFYISVSFFSFSLLLFSGCSTRSTCAPSLEEAEFDETYELSHADIENALEVLGVQAEDLDCQDFCFAGMLIDEEKMNVESLEADSCTYDLDLSTFQGEEILEQDYHSVLGTVNCSGTYEYMTESHETTGSCTD